LLEAELKHSLSLDKNRMNRKKTKINTPGGEMDFAMGTVVTASMESAKPLDLVSRSTDILQMKK